MKTIDFHAVLFWLGVVGTIASAVAQEFGADTHVALVASSVLMVVTKAERAIQAFEDSQDVPAPPAAQSPPATPPKV